MCTVLSELFSISVDLAYKTAPQFQPEISRKNPRLISE